MDKRALITAALVIGLAFMGSAAVVAGTIYKIKGLDDTLAVTGSAKTEVKSDLVKWRMTFSRTVFVNNLKGGYSDMSRDLSVVKEFFKKNGIEESSLTISPVFVDKNYSYTKESGAPQEYNLQQTVELQSKDIAKIKSLANDTKYIIDNGVIFSPQAPEYYFTGLADIRISLLGEAVKDAKSRAVKIAESGDRKIGSLRSTSVGVTQMTAVNSVSDISDYGAYDTSTEDKEVMITVRTVFSLK